MDNDDLPIGRVLHRREALKLMAATGAAVLVGCDRGDALANSATVGSPAQAAGNTAATALPGCVVRPEVTVGPYFLNQQLNRSDIRVEPSTGVAKTGMPLTLEFNVSQVTGGQCVPLKGAIVDVWHCDADGAYSGFEDRGAGFNTVGQKFLRGYQLTSDKGVARFTTIYPGWYSGRTVHVHFKIRAPWAPGAKVTDSNKQYDFTSQLFFDESDSDRIFAQAPYSAKGKRDMTNDLDGIYRQSGESLLVKLTPADQGYVGNFDVGLDLSDVSVGAEESRRGPLPGGRRG